MIPRELVEMNARLPLKLSELAEVDPDKALHLLSAWGKGTKTLRVLWSEVTNALEVQNA